MFARGFANKNGLRTFLIAGALFICNMTSVHAESMVLNFNGVAGAVGNAGQYRFTTTTATSTFGAAGFVINAHCISQATFINSSDIYNTRDDVHNLPTPGTAMGNVAAIKIAILINEVYGSGALGAYDSSSATVGWAAVQSAIWKIINPSASVPVPVEGAILVAAVNALYTSAGGVLANYFLPFAGNADNRYIHGLDADEGSGGGNAGQDQIYWDGSPNFIIDVPVPAGAILAGVGIFCVSGFTYLRRRKVTLA